MNFKKVTHVAAALFAAAVGFAVSPAGEALVRQYPKLAAVSTLLGLLGSLYHSPKNA